MGGLLRAVCDPRPEFSLRGGFQGGWVGGWGCGGGAPPPPPKGDPELLEGPEFFFFGLN